LIHPTPSELLARIADALTETVLPELDAAEARIQLQVAVLILRRLAGPAGDVGPYLDADTRDVAATIDGWLDRLALPADSPFGHGAGSAVAARELVDEVLASAPVPTTAQLVTRYEAVQALLVDVQRTLRELPTEHEDRVTIDAELRELLWRMVGRESEIHTTYSAW
jgi:hypothetical protein